MDKQALINLHEELFLFLMNYRKQAKFGDPTFLLRSDETDEDREALEEGRWFYDSPKAGWVYFCFTKGSNSTWAGSILRFDMHVKGNWRMTLNALNNGQDLRPILRSLGDILVKGKELNEVNSEKLPSGWQKLTITSSGTNYQEVIQNSIEDFFFWYSSEKRASSDDMWSSPVLSLIPEADFQQSLHTIQTYRKKRKPTSVYLNSFSIQDYKAISRVEGGSFPTAPNWIFLTGDNGLGKTSLLEALSLGLYEDAEASASSRGRRFKVELSYTYTYENASCIIVDNDSERPLFFRSLPALGAYGATRLEVQAWQTHSMEADNSTATYNLFEDKGMLKSIDAELLISSHDAPEKFEIICSMLKRIIPSLGRIERKGRDILYYEQVPSSAKEEYYPPVRLKQLSVGVRSMIAMIGDIYLRLSEAQAKIHDIPRIEQEDQVTEPDFDYTATVLPEDLVGIVIIDELDLHLHPKWQRELPSLLSGVFPRVQFIASTHSPIPLLGAPEGSVFLKVDRTVEEGVQVLRLKKLEEEMLWLIALRI